MGRRGYAVAALVVASSAALLDGLATAPMWDPTSAVVLAGFILVGARLIPVAAPLYVLVVMVLGPAPGGLVALFLMGLVQVLVLFVLGQLIRAQRLFRDGHLGGWPTVVAFAATSTVFALLMAEARVLTVGSHSEGVSGLASQFGRLSLIEALGIVTFTPAIVAVGHRLSNRAPLLAPQSRQGLELMGLASVTALVGFLATRATFDHGAPLLYMVIVPLIVLAGRRRALGGALGVAIISYVVAMVMAGHADEPGVVVDAGIFVAVMAIAGLSAGAAAEERHTAAERLHRTLEADPDGKFLLDETGTVVYANASAGRMFGWSAPDMVGQPIGTWFATVVPELNSEPAGTPETFDQPLAGTWATGAGGREFPADVRMAVLPDGGYITSVRDVTEQARLNQELKRMARFDSLTGLPNRTSLVESLPDILARSHRLGRCVAVLYCDLDGFKAVNDMHGHPFGDRLLTSIALRLKEALRPGDIIARLGGDEFVCVAESVSGELGAITVAERLIQAVSAPIAIDHLQVTVGLSVGVALSGPDSTPDRLLSSADSALYESKRNGRGRYTFFDEELARESRRRVVTAKAVQDGLNEDRFTCWYQPIVDLQTGRLSSAEALLRWSHPDEGILAADSFIEVAEQSGLVLKLTSRVVRDVALAARDVEPGQRVWFNLSAIELAHSDLYSIVVGEIEAVGCDPNSLGVEITESCAEEVSDAADKLSALRALGLQVAIDDFGTGYSSLARLLSLPIDVVKIDKSLVQPLPNSAKSEQVVSAVVELAHRLGYRVTAEGIETAAQYDMLRSMGIDSGQGYLIGKPAPRVTPPRPVAPPAPPGQLAAVDEAAETEAVMGPSLSTSVAG